jgi:outer membrane protein assembly factor BamD
MKQCSVVKCLAVVSLMAIVGCHKDVVLRRELSPEDQFANAKAIFDKRDYYKAKMQLLVVVLNNPGHRIIEQAQFYLAESYFYSKEYDAAIEEYEKLIRSLPQSPFVDDARYKVGMCYFKTSPGYALDQENTWKAIAQFQYFLEEFPNSELRPEVEQRMVECRTKLAKKVFKTGELYRKMGYFRASLLSFDSVLQTYYDTEWADDAMYWKGVCYMKLQEWENGENVLAEFLQKYKDTPMSRKATQLLRDIQKKKAVS